MNSNRFRRFIPAATLALLCSASALYAHPGHGLGEADARHLLTSPDHLAVLALGGLGAWFGSRFVQRRLPRRALQSLGLAAVAVVAVLRGFGH